MTLTYVADCSLVIDALSAREEDELLRQRLSAPRTLHAPHHLDVEVASTVRGLAAGKKITGHRGEQMLADYAHLRITRHPVWPYHPRMWELRHNLGACDAAYGCMTMSPEHVDLHRMMDRLAPYQVRALRAVAQQLLRPGGGRPTPVRPRFRSRNRCWPTSRCGTSPSSGCSTARQISPSAPRRSRARSSRSAPTLIADTGPLAAG